MTSTIKVNNIQNQCGANIINENSNTITIGASGDTVSLASGASQSGFGRTGTVNWQTSIKTSTFTAASGEGYFIDTNSGGFTVNLPAGSAGDIVAFKDYRNTFDTGNLILSPNGTDKIGGINLDATLDTESQSVTLIFTDSTRGWLDIHDSTSAATGTQFIIATGGTITESGNDRIHTFTGPGTFTVSAAAACAANNIVSHLVVAGGGGGGSLGTGGTCQGQGAGGAGGFREVKSPVTPYTASPLDGYPSAPNRITVSAQSYPITVGGGGAGGAVSPPEAPGASGGNSIFSTVTSAGGGGGSSGCAPLQVQGNGGSGGGAARYGGSPGTNPEAAGVGNTPPVTPSQGNPGGQGFFASSSLGAGGGGGGAGGAGSTNTPASHPGNGGVGVTTSISSSSLAYAGGGASQNGGSSPCGSGASNPAGGGTGVSAPDNRGGGGASASGGPGCFAGGAGGSGIVIIRYKFQ